MATGKKLYQVETRAGQKRRLQWHEMLSLVRAEGERAVGERMADEGATFDDLGIYDAGSEWKRLVDRLGFEAFSQDEVWRLQIAFAGAYFSFAEQAAYARGAR